MSRKAEQIRERYLRGYITDEQLFRYFELGVINEEEYKAIYAEKHPEPNEVE